MSVRMQVNEFADSVGVRLRLIEPSYFDAAIVGIVESFGAHYAVGYDRAKVIGLLVSEDGMDQEEAQEYFDCNIAGAYVGEGTPVFIDLVNQE